MASIDRVFETVPILRTLRGGRGRRRKDGGWYWHTGDLDRAGITLADDRGRTVDLHALRTTFISWLGLYGVDTKGADHPGPARSAGSDA